MTSPSWVSNCPSANGVGTGVREVTLRSTKNMGVRVESRGHGRVLKVLRDHRDRDAGLKSDGSEGMPHAVHRQGREVDCLWGGFIGGILIGQLPGDTELPGDRVGVQQLSVLVGE